MISVPRTVAACALTLCGCATHHASLVQPPNPGLPASMLQYSLVRARQGPPDSVGYWGTYQTDTGDSTVRVRIAAVSRVTEDLDLHCTLEKTAEKLRSSSGSSDALRWEAWAGRSDSIHMVLAGAPARGAVVAVAHFGLTAWQFFSEGGNSATDLRRFVSAYLDALVMAGLAGGRAPSP